MGDPDGPPNADSRFAWTAPQRRVLLVLLSALFLGLAVRYACNPVYVSDPQPPRPPRYGELADRIDPNAADWQTLAAIPSLGERRAKDIVAYRDEVQARDRGRAPFTQPYDLLKVRGVGVASVEAMEPHLVFPRQDPWKDAPTTAP